ncbi:ABC transporter ATP-binding protein [Geoalkalibacter halelectricus]|uniref:ATP-binding cassette domain-containing protein n=1 Tax=Geoalkalibacter halelectricus TaxID=2847045 RepID=A0ABY5ZJ60_9BACT|nr:ATP-binding cassette domain-containing protein [Geoalkalibacter halelectricus]MDO3378241.1 ATP-binding cassette domain-containing protein [Geoalkalibacter halelectricus]UWZ79168.1 ATP-binding cassette domain-containing protein [Geoalkalibacter halelectricus]
MSSAFDARAPESAAAEPRPAIRVRGLTLAYGERVIQRDLNFDVSPGAIFIIMGGSGCGKSTLLRHLVGLQRPAAGEVFFRDLNFWEAPEEQRKRFLRHCGILYQSGALWSSLTLAENVELPLREYTRLSRGEIRDLAQFKLALVGLAGFGTHYPAEISGGMRKRAGLARALALDPEFLFFDEPSAGLDPLSARRLDDLILELRASLGATVVVVTHELASIFAIGTDSVFLDAESRTQIARGHPAELRDASPDPRVRRFLTRGAED